VARAPAQGSLTTARYDVVGDIHGHADKLEALLASMGYRHRMGAWRHPEATAIFVGDFIDRGPGQRRTLALVRAMIDAGTARAVMGNHELNAIAWHTPHEGGHLRPRNVKNLEQHKAFLAELGRDRGEHAAWIAWFHTLPLWLDLPELAVIHACWHPRHIAHVAARLGAEARATPEWIVDAHRRGSADHAAAEALTKGLEIELPPPIRFVDKGGVERHEARTRWWDRNADTYRKAALIGAADPAQLPDTPIPASALLGYPANAKPVFFGHYWFTGTPAPLAANVACVDYSAGKGGSLVAYRWEGEPALSPSRFVSAG
jgi:hypothetical protein